MTAHDCGILCKDRNVTDHRLKGGKSRDDSRFRTGRDVYKPSESPLPPLSAHCLHTESSFQGTLGHAQGCGCSPSELTENCVVYKIPSRFPAQIHILSRALPGAAWEEGSVCETFLTVHWLVVCLPSNPTARWLWGRHMRKVNPSLIITSLSTWNTHTHTQIIHPSLENDFTWLWPHPPRKATSLNSSSLGLKGLCVGRSPDWAEAIWNRSHQCGWETGASFS